jgi:2-iminobutanoate/2-iminopropanoate deaminase
MSAQDQSTSIAPPGRPGARRNREEISIGMSPPLSHYTDAVRFGDCLFISGIAALDANLNVISDDVVEQTCYIFEAMKQILEKSGAGFDDVLRVTVYLTDVTDRPLIDPIRRRYFGDVRPASTLIGVSALAVPGMKVEIEAIAGVPRR